jgi:integrase
MPSARSPKTLRQAAEAYITRLKLYGRAAVTVSNHEEILARMARYFPLDGSAEKVQLDIDGYLEARRAAGGGDPTVLLELKLLRSWCRAAGVPTNWELPPLRLKRRERYCPPDDEVAKMYLGLTDLPMQRAFLLALLAGMRPAEVFRLQWPAFRGRYTLVVPAEKTGTETPVWVTMTLRSLLLNQRGTHGPVIDISPTTVRGRLSRLSRKLGLEHEWSGLVYLRHACATWALDAGITEREVDAVLSHAAGGILRRHYDHRTVERMARATRRVIEAVEDRFTAAVDVENHVVRGEIPWGN